MARCGPASATGLYGRGVAGGHGTAGGLLVAGHGRQLRDERGRRLWDDDVGMDDFFSTPFLF